MNQFSQLSKFYILIILFCGSSIPVIAQNSWVDLLEDGNLNHFEKLNGEAEFMLKDGILTGVSTMNTPNTFMATKKKYGDFILEFEVLLDNDLNSGVQFRSLSSPDYRDNRVHGYQCELETSARKWAGGIFDEARRGWLYPLSVNKKGQNAFKTGSWNKVRIQAIGSHINTWINGIHCARLVDDMTSEGFIAFQVHSIGKKELEGKKVHWKNVKICTKNLKKEKWTEASYAKEISYLKNELTKNEKRKGWRLLWDGKSTNGWVGAKILNDFPAKGWVIEDGNLVVLPSDGGESTNGGDIITKKKYSNFELELEFMLTEGGNSGIKYFVDPFLNKGPGSAIGLEFQILDDKMHPDAKKGVNGNRTVGSLYDLIPAGNLSESNRKNKRANSIGSWNKARIISKNGYVEHWLNNIKVVEYDRFSQIFRALVDNSKYVDWPKFGQLSEGNILLQDHGDRVSFRSIKIREF